MGLFRRKPKKPRLTANQLADLMYVGMVRFALKGEDSIHSIITLNRAGFIGDQLV